jgi:hypothetical protein
MAKFRAPKCQLLLITDGNVSYKYYTLNNIDLELSLDHTRILLVILMFWFIVFIIQAFIAWCFFN